MCRDVHGLDLGVLAKRHNMDTLSFIRYWMELDLDSFELLMMIPQD